MDKFVLDAKDLKRLMNRAEVRNGRYSGYKYYVLVYCEETKKFYSAGVDFLTQSCDPCTPSSEYAVTADGHPRTISGAEKLAKAKNFNSECIKTLRGVSDDQSN